MTHPALQPHAMILAVLLVAQPAQAVDSSTRICNTIADVAQVVMLKRQQGVPQRDMLAATDGFCEPSQICSILTHVSRYMIVEAYKEPRYHNPENAGVAAATYSETWRLRCANAVENN